MSSIESKTPYFGLVDFFLYLAPGTMVLLSIMLAAGITPADLSTHSSLATSLLAMLVAYFLGHAIYPLSYLLRNEKLHKALFCNRKTSNLDRYKESFSKQYQVAIFAHPEFCLSQLVRYKSLARFSIAMVWPSLFMAIGIILYLNLYAVFKKPFIFAIFSVIVLLVIAYGFFCRFGRYWRRAEQIEEHCKLCTMRKVHRKDICYVPE